MRTLNMRTAFTVAFCLLLQSCIVSKKSGYNPECRGGADLHSGHSGIYKNCSYCRLVSKAGHCKGFENAPQAAELPSAEYFIDAPGIIDCILDDKEISSVPGVAQGSQSEVRPRLPAGPEKREMKTLIRQVRAHVQSERSDDKPPHSSSGAVGFSFALLADLLLVLFYLLVLQGSTGIVLPLLILLMLFLFTVGFIYSSLGVKYSPTKRGRTLARLGLLLVLLPLGVLILALLFGG